jgi:hypothetical protein
MTVTFENPPRRFPDSASARILAEVEDRGIPVRPLEIAVALDMPVAKVSNLLRSMAASGKLKRVRPEDAPANGPGASLYGPLDR